MSKPFMESVKKTEKRRPTDVLTGRYDDIMKVIHDVKDRMISRTWTNYREQVKADLQGVLWPIKWSYEHLEHLNQKYDKFNTEISQLKSIRKQLKNDLDQGYFDRKSEVYDFLRDAKTAAEVISHSISKVETWIHEAYYAHSIYDTSYDPEKDFKKLQNLYSDLFLLKKEITHMTKSECLHRIVSCYNILAEMYDKIDYDYTEDHPVKTSRFGFAEKPEKTETRGALDRLMPEIHMNINELAKNSWTYSGAKKVVEKMIKAFEYIQNEFNKINHTGDKIVNKIVNKFATNKLFDLISDSYVPMLDDQVDDIFQEEKLSSGDRKELDDSQFGIPSLRKYPLTDEKHVLQAVRFFNKAPKEHKRELAKNIVKRAKELGMDWEKWESLKPYLDEKVQESWQDRKNGINSHSKKQFFHVSFDDSFHNKTLYPRIPSYIANGKYDESEDNKYKENTTTKRICGSASIEGCLQAIVNNGDRIHLAGKELYVYVPEKPLSEYKIKTNKEIVEDKDVFDANLTGEMWILEPCKMKLYGTIVVDQISDKKEKPIVGDKDTKLNKYTFKWRWQVKPKAMDMEYADWEDDKNKITKVDDVPFDKVYFGMDKDVGDHMDLDRPLFVTPYKGLASIFAASRNPKVNEYLRGSGYDNRGYEEWSWHPDKLKDYLDEVHMLAEGAPDLKPTTIDCVGYVYEIDMKDVTGYIGKYPWMNQNEREYLICDQDSIKFKPHEVRVKMHIKGAPSKRKDEHVQEAVDINSLRQQCGEVFQQASQIHYGCLDENGERITASPFKDSWKMISTYHSQSIQSIEQSKLGVCFEHSFYIANLLKQRNLPYQTFFLNVYIEHEEDHSRDLSFWHQFTIVPNDTDSVVLIETSLTPDKNGVFLVQNMDDAVQHLIKSFNIQLSQEDTQLMKQDLIDVSTFQPRDGDTYIGYIDQVYQQGKSIKHEINIKKYVKLMKVLWEYMDEHDMLSPDGKNIYNQAKEMDDATAFDLMGLLRVPQLFQGEEQTFIGDMIDEDFHNLTPKQLESKLKGYVQESYMGMKHNTLKEKYHYIPLTPQSKQQYQDQGVFQFGLRRTRVNDNTKGTIFIDENHIVVAYVAVEKKINGERWITALEVSEEYQGHGYGVELLQVAVDDFGATYLSVNKNNTKALTMYQRYGWSICDETDHMFFMKLDEGNDE